MGCHGLFALRACDQHALFHGKMRGAAALGRRRESFSRKSHREQVKEIYKNQSSTVLNKSKQYGIMVLYVDDQR